MIIDWFARFPGNVLDAHILRESGKVNPTLISLRNVEICNTKHKPLKEAVLKISRDKSAKYSSLLVLHYSTHDIKCIFKVPIVFFYFGRIHYF